MGDFPFMPEVAGMLTHLAARGLAAVIITNGHHTVQRDKLEACGAASLFPEPEMIIVGGEEVMAGRAEKPAVSIFAKACAAAGCAPGEAIHVGDSLATDVQGGINSELRATVWVNPAGKVRKAGDPEPTYVVRTMEELPGIVDQLMAADAA